MPNASNPQVQGFGRRLQQGLAKAQQSPAEHPEPNLLAAFAEHTLSKREQAQVFEHLAICGLCREVVALSTPEPEAGAAEVASATQKWSAFFSKWSWVPLTACTVALLAVIGITVTRPAREARQTASVLEQQHPQTRTQSQSEAKSQAQAKPDNPVATAQAEAAENKGSISSSTRVAIVASNAPVVALQLRSGVAGGVVTGESEKKLKKDEFHGTLNGDMSMDLRRERDASTSFFGTSSAGSGADQSVRGVANAASPASATAQKTGDALDREMTTATNAELGANLSRLPHDKDQNQVQARQVYPPRGPATTTEFQPGFVLLDDTTRAAKTTNTRQDASGHASANQIASAAPPQERPSPDLAFATGTPLWNVQNGVAAQSNAGGQDEARNSQANRSVSYDQPVVLARSKGVRLPQNEVALKAQLGTTFFLVSQNGTLKVSRDNGTSWKDVFGPWKGLVKNVYTIGTLVHVETAANETWTSSDQGTTWTQVKQNP